LGGLICRFAIGKLAAIEFFSCASNGFKGVIPVNYGEFDKLF